MSTVKRQIIEIPIHELNGMDRMFGSMLNLDLENLPTKYKSAFDQTRELSFQHFTMKGVYESFEVDKIDRDTIRLKNGTALESKLMAEIFRHSFELVFLVVSVAGYDELDAAEDNMFQKLFLDNWGTAFIECGNRWAEHTIAKELEEKKIFCTHSFSPGQNDIPIEMQAQIFQALNPEEIGVTLSKKYMMHPKKSVSGIFGIQTEEPENRIRPCDLCEKRATCPNAYDKLE
ncbi:MAG TPA: hypothetical protein VEA58_14000 [Anaerovoracaceae bacterium]|nr:hypothetical protein [Anaerovoracaceae bacterium]